MIEPRADRPRVITLGADKAYDAEDFVNELRSMTVTPHVGQNTSGRSYAALKTSVSISWHLGHSKVRSSRHSSIGVTLIIFICAPHCRQAGIK
jgi:hypothetical protein